MASSVGEAQKIDMKPQTKIPSRAKVSNLSKSIPSSFNKFVMMSSNSKIPKRSVGIFKKCTVESIKSDTGASKMLDKKNTTKSVVSLSSTRTRPHSVNPREKVKTPEPTARSHISEQICEKFPNASERVAAKKNLLAFRTMKGKIRIYQTKFIKKWETIKDNLPPDEGEYKLIDLVKNEEGKLVPDNIDKIKVMCTESSLENIKNDIKAFVENNIKIIIESLEQLKAAATNIGQDPTKIRDCINTIEVVQEKIKTDNELESILNQIENYEAQDKTAEYTKNSQLEVKVARLLNEVKELRKKLEESEKEISKKRINTEEETDLLKKELEKRDQALEKKQAEYDELKNQIESIEQNAANDATNYKNLQEELNNKMLEIEELKKQKTVQDKNQDYENAIKKLETDLTAALKDVENQAEIERKIADQATAYADEIKQLKEVLTRSQIDRDKQENEVESLKNEIRGFAAIRSKLLISMDRGMVLEKENQNLHQNIKDLENRLLSSENLACINREIHEELNRLKKADNENNQNVEVLQTEITKARSQNQKLEEKIAMDGKLLKVRADLIETLQTKENSQKIHIADLCAEVASRNNDLDMLKMELVTKTEEFQDLFTTLNTKQFELTRQEHVINLLQDSNRRVQTLRVKHEARIGRLEDKVAKLKRTITLYQGAILPSNALRHSLLMADSCRESDENEDLEYYVDEQHKKRHQRKEK